MLKNKFIHQIWFQDTTFNFNLINKSYNYKDKIMNSNIPDKYKKNSLSWINKNKKYKYFLWNEKSIKELLFLYYNNLLPVYDNLELMIMKIDFAKYIILYHYGGMYCDLDTLCLRNIDPLFYYYKKYNIILTKTPEFTKLEKFFLSNILNKNYKKNFINNGIIISNKKHPFWLDLISNITKSYNKYPFFLHTLNIFNRTGPLAVMDCYYHNQYKYNDIVLAKSIFLEPCYGQDISCLPKPISFSIHYHHANWLSQLPDNISIFNGLIKYWYKNIVPLFSYFYFSYFRNYHNIILVFLILILIVII